MKGNVADVIIIGSGIAGLMAAELLSFEKNVIIITKSELDNSNSYLAQGGIAAVSSNDDDWRDHFIDTLIAGAYHNNHEMTRLLVQKGPEMINKLIQLGVKFDRDENGSFILGKEGAHRKRRILHAGGDATGKELVTKLIKRVKEHVRVIEHEMALDLIIQDGQCLGVEAINKENELTRYYAPHTVLATGGAGQLYEVTSNSPVITGDGIAMAFRAGAKIVDMEFVQFHPTMLVKQGKGIGLVSEAVRGEGARLRRKNGNYLMDGIHEMKDLAPRDIVAREIHHALKRGEQLFLDISMIDQFNERFPTITSICSKGGIDFNKGIIPVSPGAHFLMGGVEANKRGETSIPGLYAIGEVARTGVHGANRLASNSLLEGVVFANELAQAILHSTGKGKTSITVNLESRTPLLINLPTKMEIQQLMSKHVGIVRSEEGLFEALSWFKSYRKYFCKTKYIPASFEENEIVNMLLVGYLITYAAYIRKESRGGHYRSDYPFEQASWLKAVVCCSLNNEEPYVNQTVQEKIPV